LKDEKPPSKSQNSTIGSPAFEHLFWLTRWFLVPFYIGVMVAMLLLLVKFMQKLVGLVLQVFSIGEKNLMLVVLTMVDIALVANLLAMVAFVSYHLFISTMGSATGASNKPTWLTSTDYHGLKLKAIGSVSVICVIELLRVFLNIQDYDQTQVAWRLAILLAIAVTGLLLAAMDYMGHHD
jgi:uncharacterized protein (TIGR00645 family)